MNTLLDKLRGVIQKEVTELFTKIGTHIENDSSRPEKVNLIQPTITTFDRSYDIRIEIVCFNKKHEDLFTFRIIYDNFKFNIDDWDARERSLSAKVKEFKYKSLSFIEEEIEKFNNE